MLKNLIFFMAAWWGEASWGAAGAVILPWSTYGLSFETEGMGARSLGVCLDHIGQNISGGTSVGVYPGLEGLPVNLQRRMAALRYVATPAQMWQGLVLKPSLCAMGPLVVVSLAALPQGDSFVWRRVHQVLPLKEWAKLEVRQKAVTELRVQLQGRLPVGGQEASPGGLRLILNEGRSGYTCLKHMVADQLMAEGIAVELDGFAEELEALRYALAFPHKSITSTPLAFPLGPRPRANTSLTLYWSSVQQAYTLPQTFSLSFTAAETIFGNRWQDRQTRIVQLATEGRQLKMTWDKPLAQVLAHRRVLLDVHVWPRVVKVHKAWAYVDKGRGWGLELDDRMVSEPASGDEVKGHVVGFYGPEMDLKDAQGHAIVEGAILYMRKGQRGIKMGQNFRFDPQEFPTPWPPAPVPGK